MKRWIVASCLWASGCAAASDPNSVSNEKGFVPAASPEDGATIEDGASPEPDAAVPKDSGSATASDSGTTVVPDSSTLADSGSAADTGSPKADSGSPTADSGSPTADSGWSKADSGAPKPPKDTGADPVDTGTSGDTGTAAIDSATVDSSSGSSSGTLVTLEVTFYGWPDNSPPGPAIALPIIHKTAGGKGTYADPITFATAPGEFAAGTILYVPFIQKYVIMEDTCSTCTTDWASGKRHIDVWMNSDGNNNAALLACEDSWTQSATAVEINPPPDRPVIVTPLFDTTTGVCLK